MSQGSSRIPGFYRLGVACRRRRIAELRDLGPDELALLDGGGLDVDTADGMIENVIGTYALPLGVALNFRINDIDYLVPMAIEEPSVVAAASNAAKMIRAGGGFRAVVSDPIMIGQIQLLDVADPEHATAALEAASGRILTLAASLAPGLSRRGGGPVGLEVRALTGDMLVVHLLVDCRDAMGANTVNSMAEGIADELASIAGARVGLRILSNLSDSRTTTVSATIPDSALGKNSDEGAGVRRAIVEASQFADVDPYRAATHNKGIMNGIDGVLLATGNDWRGVEAGAHAFACRDGSYSPLSSWTDEDGTLTGTMTVPMAVGTVGGALHLHRGARLALALLATDTAAELAGVVACAGLASNLAALRALATDGIQRGHMSLHARVVARAAGATGQLIERVATEIARLGDVKPERAAQILTRLRAERDLQTTLEETS